MRERQAEIERHIFEDMLIRKTSEGRWYPRRHQRIAMLAFIGLILVIFILVLVLDPKAPQ